MSRKWESAWPTHRRKARQQRDARRRGEPVLAPLPHELERRTNATPAARR